MNEPVLWASGHGILLLLVIAGIAFVSGYWAILLALGTAVYHLILDTHSSDNAPTTVAISYGAALVIGWVAYLAIAQGIEPTAIEPMSESGLYPVGSALVAFAGTTWIIYIMNTHQPMAFVAAFTAAVGALPPIQSLVGAILAALLMACIQAVRRQYGPEFGTSPMLLEEQPFGT